MSTQSPVFAEGFVPPDVRIGIVAARFNQKIVDALLDGCRQRLLQLGINEKHIEVFRVPGAFELPLGAKLAAQTRRFAALICIGAVVRGETPHFEYVSGQCASGILQVGLSESLPVIFGVLTVNTEEQAWERCGGSHGHAGRSAAEAAVEMMALQRKLAN